MKPEEQTGNTPSGQPTSMTGSDWQRQALAGARAKAAVQKSDVAAPGAQAARERAAAQEVPDMLAAVDPVPAQPAQNPQQAQVPQSTSPASTEAATGKPVVSGALAADAPDATPIIGTGGTPTGKKILIALLILVVLLGAGAAGYFLFLKDKQAAGNNANQQGSAAAESDDEAEATVAPQVVARNEGRLMDVDRIIAGVAEFTTNNSGKLPSSYTAGSLVGNEGDMPSEVSLGHYETLQIKAGAQDPLDSDELWLVTGAQCNSDTGGAVAGTARAVAVLYVQEDGSGSFEGACKDSLQE